MSVPSDWFEIVHAEPGGSISGVDALRNALKKKTEPEFEPEPSANSPARRAQADEDSENGTNAGEKIPEKEGWDPYNEDLQYRYGADKAAIIKNECERRKINIKGLVPREAHQLLREAGTQANTPKGPSESNTNPNATGPENTGDEGTALPDLPDAKSRSQLNLEESPKPTNKPFWDVP